MNRKIQKSLLAEGHALAPPADEPPAKPFFAWFNEDVFGLDSEEYRRAFWREVNRTGHSIGHAPRTLESWQNVRGVHPAARPGEIHSNGKCKTAFVIHQAFFSLHFPFSIQKSRPSYYAAERAHRQGRRATTNPRHSPDAIRALYAQVRRNPEAALRLDPACVPALAAPSAVRTARTPRRLLGWLLRRRSA